MNAGYDQDFDMPAVENLGYDGQNLQRMNAGNLQIYSTSGAGYTYFCFSAPGTALATAKWQVFRVGTGANLLYADHNANYDNIATDPTLLTYNYS